RGASFKAFSASTAASACLPTSWSFFAAWNAAIRSPWSSARAPGPTRPASAITQVPSPTTRLIACSFLVNDPLAPLRSTPGSALLDLQGFLDHQRRPRDLPAAALLLQLLERVHHPIAHRGTFPRIKAHQFARRECPGWRTASSAPCPGRPAP